MTIFSANFTTSHLLLLMFKFFSIEFYFILVGIKFAKSLLLYVLSLLFGCPKLKGVSFLEIRRYSQNHHSMSVTLQLIFTHFCFIEHLFLPTASFYSSPSVSVFPALWMDVHCNLHFISVTYALFYTTTPRCKSLFKKSCLPPTHHDHSLLVSKFTVWQTIL